jgi:glycosyltransferase involved in cell wall biosynthesis
MTANPGARARVLVVQPSLQPPGGGNAVAAWMVQALVERHDVSVLSWKPIDLDAVNRYYGTTIRESDIRRLDMPKLVQRPIEAMTVAAVLLKASLLFRYAKTIAPRYDVVVCGHNETDFGSRCLQYVHYPARLRPRPATDLKWFHLRPLLVAYYRAADRIAGFRAERVAEAITLANSTWTAELMTNLYGPSMVPLVVHPPVAADMPEVAWDRRDDGFVCVGRIAPEKELESVVEIVRKVQAHVPAAHLHLAGSRGANWYTRRIEKLAADNPAWVHLHADVTRDELFGLISTHRYGIHGMRQEHFGIAPAELLAGGCIPFVPNDGGQVDIVGAEPRLRYSCVDEAVRNIVAVMTSPVEQAALRAYLRSRRDLFSTRRFVATIQSLVEEVRNRA